VGITVDTYTSLTLQEEVLVRSRDDLPLFTFRNRHFLAGADSSIGSGPLYQIAWIVKHEDLRQKEEKIQNQDALEPVSDAEPYETH
jgi:hypothetical protein